MACLLRRGWLVFVRLKILSTLEKMKRNLLTLEVGCIIWEENNMRPGTGSWLINDLGHCVLGG